MAVIFNAELHCDHEGCNVSTSVAVVLRGNTRGAMMKVLTCSEHTWTELDGLHYCPAHPPQAHCIGSESTYPCGFPVPSVKQP
jgi:hypothetical protein